MSESELREFVKHIQTQRASAITFRAEVVKRAEAKEDAKRAKSEANTKTGFEALLE